MMCQRSCPRCAAIREVTVATVINITINRQRQVVETSSRQSWIPDSPPAWHDRSTNAGQPPCCRRQRLYRRTTAISESFAVGDCRRGHHVLDVACLIEERPGLDRLSATTVPGLFPPRVNALCTAKQKARPRPSSTLFRPHGVRPDRLRSL